MTEVAEWEDLYSKPFAEDRGPMIVGAMHDNANGDPVFSMYFKYASEGLQSGVEDAQLDQMIADATAATGEEREQLWSDAVRLHQRRRGCRRAAVAHGWLQPGEPAARLHADDQDQQRAAAAQIGFK